MQDGGGRHLEKPKNRHISAKQQFDRSPRSLACCRSLTLLILQSDKISKSKMAAAAIVKDRKIAILKDCKIVISQQRFDQSLRNLVR